jgi:hypothetical protein
LLRIRISRIDKDLTYSYYGPFDMDILGRSATDFIISISDAITDEIDDSMRVFMKLAHRNCQKFHGAVQQEARTHSCWLTIRMTIPTADYVEPRWHRDGCMFECSCPEPKFPHSKYAVSLSGPSTRILTPGDYVDSVMTRKSQPTNETRSELAVRLLACPELRVESGQVIRFSWGQPDSPVHSEPESSNSHRIFTSLLFGSEDEIREMCEVRAWEYGKGKAA